MPIMSYQQENRCFINIIHNEKLKKSKKNDKQSTNSCYPQIERLEKIEL